MKYVDNLEIDILYNYITPSMVDCLYEFDIIDNIKKYCDKDYQELENMISEAINFTNMEKIISIPEMINNNKIDDLVSAIKNLKDDLSPELLEKLRVLSVDNSDEMSIIRDTLATSLHQNLFQKDLNDAEKLGQEEEKQAKIEE